ncbi:MAG: CYTH domain-containing protein [Candidatus Paceibacterota bacterium]
MSHTYEIEIKSLLGSEENAKALKEQLNEKEVEAVGTHSQLNHYFNSPGDLSELEKEILSHIPEERRDALRKIIEEGEDHSVRTREADGTVLFIIKASIDEGSSANTVSRIEFEEEVDMSLDELDQLLLDSGLTYQAKWSREREEFRLDDTNITIDKNAGYGYLAEFEKVVEDEEKVPEVRSDLARLMDELGVEELSQDRLERMFAHYNENWEEYYGTDKIFVIE